MLWFPRWLTLTCLLLLAACGGGDPEPAPDERVPTPGVDCTADPALCR